MQTAEPPDDLISTIDAGKILRCTSATVLRWILQGRIPGYRCGYRWRVSRADVLAQIRAFTVADANNRKLADAATRPATRQELDAREKEVDEYLRKVGIRK